MIPMSADRTLITILVAAMLTHLVLFTWTAFSRGRPNAWVGFRTSATRPSQAAWNSSQRPAWVAKIWVVIPLGIAVVVVASSKGSAATRLAVVAAVAACDLSLTVVAVRRGNRAAASGTTES